MPHTRFTFKKCKKNIFFFQKEAENVTWVVINTCQVLLLKFRF